MKNLKRMLPLVLALALLAGCAQGTGAGSASSAPLTEEEIYLDQVMMEEVDIEDEAVALLEAGAALDTMLLPEASGKLVKKNSRAIIDYSNTKDGYVMVQFTGTTKTRLKVLVTGPVTKDPYNYNLTSGVWTTFPLSDGNGKYQVAVYEQNANGKYAAVVAQSFEVTLADEFAPFLRPNQYVDYASAPKTVAKAKELVGSETDPLKKVELIYDYVVKNFTYDKQLAATVKSGYLPVLDNVLEAKKGICFDYAGLMTGMLRSQGVPCKLVTGYVPVSGGKTGYHAWISVWSAETGWVEGAIYFNGSAWQRMDPTFASSGKSSSSIMNFIGDGTNYTEKNLY